MKHVPIGTIKQKKRLSSDTLYFSVSLFKGRIRRKFDTLNDAKTFAEVHIRSMLVEGETTALCVRYKRYDGFSSYLMYDFLWNEHKSDENKANEFEETEFEYLDAHTWYVPHWKKAKKVDERSYCAGDILRAGMVRSPLTNFLIVFTTVILFLTLLIGMAENFYIFNEYLTSSKWYVNMLLVFSLASLVVAIIFTIRPYIKLTRIVKRHERNFNEVDWKEVFKENKRHAVIMIVATTANLIFTLAMLLASHIETFSSSDKEILVKKILVSSVIVYAVMVFFLILTRIFIYYKMTKLVKHLFAIDEWDEFKKWLKTTDPIWEFRTIEDFFIIPNEYSQHFVLQEKNVVKQLIRTSEADEIKNYGKKSLLHYKHAVKKHLAILKGEYVDIQ